ncbi:MAG: hypothetical protein ACI8Z1_004073 [Candidatus Azotimanducaceae bacterium]|jgi:hypothetical protein
MICDQRLGDDAFGSLLLQTVPAFDEPAGFAPILENAVRLAPWLSTRSDEIEQARGLSSDVVDALRAAGVFQMNMPLFWCGPELISTEQVRAIEAQSLGDASLGWCVMVGCDSGLYCGYLDDEVARHLYPHPDVIQARGFIRQGGLMKLKRVTPYRAIGIVAAGLVTTI